MKRNGSHYGNDPQSYENSFEEKTNTSKKSRRQEEREEENWEAILGIPELREEVRRRQAGSQGQG
jgi:hypothetical protein